MKLQEIASRIHAHLKRFEGDPKINRIQDRRATYFNAHSIASGRYVSVRYVEYMGTAHLSKADAETYLAWLDAGNVGMHHKALGIGGLARLKAKVIAK